MTLDSLRTLFSVDLSEAVVGHFVHETVEESGGAAAVDSELSVGRVVVVLVDVLPFRRRAPDPNHPQ